MNKFENAIYGIIGKERFEIIQSVKIGIAGAGGLGSNCAFNLVRTGLKNLTIVDYDKVEYSNLNRQFYFLDQVGQDKVVVLKENLMRINPDLNIKAIIQKIDRQNVVEIFADCDIVVEAFDKAENKVILAEKYINSEKIFITASGLAGWGKSDKIMVRKINDTSYIVGDRISGVSPELPPISARVNVAAAKQADTILEALFSVS